MNEQLLFPDAVVTKEEKAEAQRRRNIEKAVRYNKEHPEKHNAASRKYSAEHPDRTKASRIASRKKKPELYAEQHRKASIRFRRMHPERCSERDWKYHVNNRAAQMIRSARRMSRIKGHAFDLDKHVDELQERVNRGVCELTGIPLNLNPDRGPRKFNIPSLDRIVPSKGYVYSNVRVVAWATNAMLNCWGEEIVLFIVRSWLSKIEASQKHILGEKECAQTPPSA